jgi:hypothetical protein
MRTINDPELHEKLVRWRKVFGRGPNNGAIQEHSEGREAIISAYLAAPHAPSERSGEGTQGGATKESG